MNARNREVAIARQMLAAGTVTAKDSESSASVVRRAVGRVRAEDAARRKAARKSKRDARRNNR